MHRARGTLHILRERARRPPVGFGLAFPLQIRSAVASISSLGPRISYAPPSQAAAQPSAPRRVEPQQNEASIASRGSVSYGGDGSDKTLRAAGTVRDGGDGSDLPKPLTLSNGLSWNSVQRVAPWQ
jgi:hypothetical protein